ncbi:hypothetical protein [Sporosarcina sp. HYO08]|uniref:hypothetical protein n=1 Tax=Sporosarcina sp. HYO08 TaxID=1759557 RepID=UPI00079CAEE0|nr:hypothetical protein [Sporosarcina sp. HYO08]KXH86787.1 hypothetical protein AU377_14330 [Sporosarcina sp. HYO08]
MEKLWESSYPYVFALILGVIVYLLKWEVSDVKNIDLILNATVTLSSIVIAFLGTMISILLTLTNAKVMQRIKDNGAHNTLTSYISQAIVAGLILAIYSMILFMFMDYEGKYANILLIAFVLLITFLFFSSYRIMYVISNILKSVLHEQRQEEQESPPVFKPSINKENQN